MVQDNSKQSSLNAVLREIDKNLALLGCVRENDVKKWT